LVIYHGGYGTTLEVLSNLKPSIVLPSHTEQEGNGRRLELLQVGKTILFSKDRKQLNFHWPYGNYSMNADFDFNLDSGTLIGTVNELLNNNNLDNLEPISAKLMKAQREFNINQLLNTV
jgi:hypothetical protein